MIVADRDIEYRPNTSDFFTIKEVLNPNTYAKWLQINKNDVVLDVGANIGLFSVFWGQAAKICVAFEPEEGNYKIAVQNIKANCGNNVAIFKKAVIGGIEKTINFYVNSGKRRDADSIIPKKGRKRITVDCANINDILTEYKANKLKIDCEGAEYGIIKNINNWGGIDSAVIEWHKSLLKDYDNKMYREILAILFDNFSEVEGCKDPNGWTNHLKCRK